VDHNTPVGRPAARETLTAWVQLDVYDVLALIANEDRA
jgi:hypothetical protein